MKHRRKERFLQILSRNFAMLFGMNFGLVTHWIPGARSIQPKFQPVRPGKEDHIKRWTRFFETFPVGPNRSIEFWTEISGNFGWMDRALVSTAYKALLLSPECFDYTSEVNSGSLSMNYDVFCVLWKPVMSLFCIPLHSKANLAVMQKMWMNM